ncbi:helicase associated domain-containing protein [Streptomyces sp. NPDC005386]|uniref:helicase associated domain-containing protein n=1 Tax=Streptomyces sp. NPDC005386 TaxID=3154562 RepID=UPI0033B43D1C
MPVTVSSSVTSCVLSRTRSTGSVLVPRLADPSNAVWGGDGMALGVWLKNQRAAARKTRENAERRAAGETETGVSAAGELSESRMEALDAIDPAWCPGWGIDWQRGFHLTLQYLRSAGVLPETSGEVIVQGEDLVAWTIAQRIGWDKLTPAQQWMLDSVLGLEPAGEGELQPVRKTQADRWAIHLAAARQFHAREGHLRVPHKHVEERAGGDGEVVGLRLGGVAGQHAPPGGQAQRGASDGTRRAGDAVGPTEASSESTAWSGLWPAGLVLLIVSWTAIDQVLLRS